MKTMMLMMKIQNKTMAHERTESQEVNCLQSAACSLMSQTREREELKDLQSV